MPTQAADWPEGEETVSQETTYPAPETSQAQQSQAGAATTPQPAANAPQGEAKAKDAAKPEAKPPVKPQVQAQPKPEAKPDPDNFPTDFVQAWKLLGELSKCKRLGEKPSAEQRAGHAKYHRLRRHIYTLQQGLPVLHTDSTSKGAFVGLSVTDQTRWTMKARTDLDFKKLLAAHNALAEENAELKELLKIAK